MFFPVFLPIFLRLLLKNYKIFLKLKIFTRKSECFHCYWYFPLSVLLNCLKPSPAHRELRPGPPKWLPPNKPALDKPWSSRKNSSGATESAYNIWQYITNLYASLKLREASGIRILPMKLKIRNQKTDMFFENIQLLV